MIDLHVVVVNCDLTHAEKIALNVLKINLLGGSESHAEGMMTISVLKYQKLKSCLHEEHLSYWKGILHPFPPHL